MYGCGREVQEMTNVEAEAVAMLQGLKYCVTCNYSRILLQTDSVLLKNVVEGIWSSPWNVVGHVDDIKALMESCEVRVSHIMNEGNKLADHLDNYALDFSSIEARGFVDLDIQRRRIVNSDKLLCLYLRVKVKMS